VPDKPPAPRRAHRLVLDAQADTADALAWELRMFAARIERGELTTGSIGGPYAGSNYSYTTKPEITHDAYFAAITEWLAEQRAQEAPSDGR
jgi:hypothetical protein